MPMQHDHTSDANFAACIGASGHLNPSRTWIRSLVCNPFLILSRSLPNLLESHGTCTLVEGHASPNNFVMVIQVVCVNNDSVANCDVLIFWLWEKDIK